MSPPGRPACVLAESSSRTPAASEAEGPAGIGAQDHRRPGDRRPDRRRAGPQSVLRGALHGSSDKLPVSVPPHPLRGRGRVGPDEHEAGVHPGLHAGTRAVGTTTAMCSTLSAPPVSCRAPTSTTSSTIGLRCSFS